MNGLRSSGCIYALAFVLLTLVTRIEAKIVYVDAQGKGDYPSLRAALGAAWSGDTIVLAPGTYGGSGNQDLTIVNKVLTLRSRDPNDPAITAQTILDCQGVDRSPHGAINAETAGGTAHVILAGLTIRNGCSDCSGGAVRCDEANLDAINCTFQNNRTQTTGGALYCRNNHTRLVGCTFSNNLSDTQHGGAVYCLGSQLTARDCSFEANRGGAIEAYDGQLTLTRCAFENNEGDQGGAIYNSGTQAAFSACTFIGNRAHQGGGAVCNERSSPTVVSCLFAGNTASGAGGAVQNLGSSPHLRHCTFAANRAASGGAVAAVGDSRPLLSHSILWGNTASQGPGLYVGNALSGNPKNMATTVEFCDVQGGYGGVRVESGCELAWDWAGNIDRDPLFGGPAYGDYRLSPGSPCINAGDPAYTPLSDQTDLDGGARCAGWAVDLGAYEFRGSGPVYRFVAPTSDRRFYTISASERDDLVAHDASSWRLDAVAFYAFYVPVNDDLLPVYRFWSNASGSHFYTISEEERQSRRSRPDLWTAEGVAFYAYPPGRQPLGAAPVYRLRSDFLGCSCYTSDENEKAVLLRDPGQGWKVEQIAWYAYTDYRMPITAAYDFTGGIPEAWLILTFSATVDGKQAQVVVPDVVLIPTGTWMRMTVDSAQQKTTLNSLRVQTAAAECNTTIKQADSAVTVPLTLSIQVSFTASTPQGPFSVDGPTGLFADFTGAGQNGPAKDAAFLYSGSVRLGDQDKTFEQQGAATSFELEAYGMFESAGLLPEQISARLPFTFQWHRRSVKDLLAQAVINGHSVQVYVTNADLSTQGLWKGRMARQ
jgi:predicted outer membrane repeat protein